MLWVLIRSSSLQGMIWVCIVSQIPFLGVSRLNGLMVKTINRCIQYLHMNIDEATARLELPFSSMCVWKNVFFLPLPVPASINNKKNWNILSTRDSLGTSSAIFDKGDNFWDFWDLCYAVRWTCFMGNNSREMSSPIFWKKKQQKKKTNNNKQIPWGIYVPRVIFIWGVKNGKVNQRTTGPVSNT